ncbi:MAG: Cof-type HAD-IIB family hydrolase [Lachnospiraceae bacterium]|nr:Cof-type HAD-IIB family hydrolase [Lachnospiraceae bacterium]
MKKKIFFTDLDGTLLNDKKEITPGNRAAVDLALQQGHIIVIATGRPLSSAIIQAERLGLTGEGCYLIAFNGAEIYDIFSHKKIYRKTVPMKTVEPVFEEARGLGIHVQTFSESEVLAEHEGPEIYDYVKRTLQTFRIVPSITEALKEEPCKILAIEYKRRNAIEQLQRELLKKYGDILDCYFSNDAYLEIVPSGVTKGKAVQWMCDFLGISIENSVSAGDAPNDVDMIETAHIGIAMCNAFPGVGEHADYITTLDNNHDGGAEIIHKFILEDS